ncbi:MAG: T9SS type A sorting domain-containing protein, partial [Bacteroidetes bacterium]|nr:T9SS type A sorting domain-containing protein [Bacteroidota bacterium]
VANEPPRELPTDRDTGLRVFPNPASAGDQVNLEFNAARSGTATLRVHDMLGRQVLRDEVPFVPGTHRVPLAISGLPPGVYITHLRLGDEAISGRFTVLR